MSVHSRAVANGSTRVMTYNIKGQAALWRGRHIARIAEVIREQQPDLVGVQEVHRHSWQSRFRDQAAELEALTGMRMAFGASFQNYGNVLLTREEITEIHVERLPGRGEPRSVLAAKVSDIHVFVTHLSALGMQNRVQQAAAIAAIVEASSPPYLLMGDFNANPTSEELRPFHDGKLVLSCFAPDVVTHRATRKCLDYIFVDRGWKIRNSRVVAQGPSDHWALVAELER